MTRPTIPNNVGSPGDPRDALQDPNNIATLVAMVNEHAVALDAGVAGGVTSARTINTTAPLTGGGDLSADRTLAVNTFGAAQAGVVPQSGGGTANFLRADGTWATPSNVFPTCVPQVQSPFSLGVTQNDYTPTGWSSNTAWTLKAADNEGTRITGFGALSDGVMRLVYNGGTPADDGVLVLQHNNTGSLAANRILCPDDEDLAIAKGGGVLLMYSTDKSRWIVFTPGGRQRYVTTQWLGLYPNALFPVITGTINNYNPTATNLQGNAFTGLGAAGGSLAFKDNSLCELQTTDSTGAILTGLEWISAGLGGNSEPANHGAVKVLINLASSPGAITLKHSNAGSSVGNRFFCPGLVDLVLNPGDTAIVCNVESLGWYVISNACRVDGTFSLASLKQINAAGVITPSTLALGDNNDWAPTNLATNMVLRATANSSGSNITGISATGVAAGDIKVIENFGGAANTLPLVLKHESTSSTAANRLTLPNNGDVQLPVGGSAMIIYDGSSSRWRLLAIAPRADGGLLLSGTLGVTGTTTLGVTNTGALTNTGLHTTDQLRVLGTLTPASLTSGSSTNDWNPTNFATSTTIRAQTTTGTAATLTGMQAGSTGDIKIIRNFGGGGITLNHQDAGSLAANRFCISGSAAKTIPVNGTAIFQYEQNGYWWLLSII